MSILKRIGVLAHPKRPQTAPIAEAIAQRLTGLGLENWMFTQWDGDDIARCIRDTQMVIAIGGDGAMLRAARVCAPYNVPVLGLNMGHLGFLTEIKGPHDWESQLDSVLDGHSWIEQRMMVRVFVQRDHQVIATGDALNDVVISRSLVTRMIRLHTYIDGDWTTSYNADALIISTATGSTAYALACGGPILPPELRNILVVPVAPHLSLDRPIVLPEGANVEVVISPENETEIALAVDGELLVDLLPNDRVTIQASEHISRFVRLRERHYFYRSLLDRLEPRIPVPSTRTSE